jgi:agmatinase
MSESSGRDGIRGTIDADSIAGWTEPVSPTFFDFPSSGAVHPGQIVMVGVPFDGLSTERAGSAEAPRVLRLWTTKVGVHSVRDERTHDRRAAAGIDAGDVIVDRFKPASNFERIVGCVREVAEQGGIPLLVGGDHSITYPAVSAMAARVPGLRLVQIDAHHDATDPEEWACRYNHGTFIRNLIQDGALHGEHVVQIGVRDFQWSASGA